MFAGRSWPEYPNSDHFNCLINAVNAVNDGDGEFHEADNKYTDTTDLFAIRRQGFEGSCY